MGASVGEPPISVVCAVAWTLACVFVRVHVRCGYVLMCYFCAWEPVRGGAASFLSGPRFPHPQLNSSSPGALARG